MFFSQAQETRAYIAIAPDAPVIDGTIDEVWSNSTKNPILNVVNGPDTTPDDISAFWYSLWDEQNLYFLFEVTDDMLRNNGPEATNYWIHDCAEIFLDMLNEKKQVETGDDENDDKYQYRFIYDLDDEPISENPPMDGVENVSMATEKGYNIEVKMPWTTLIGSHPFGDVIIGRSIGAEFQVADLDDNPGQFMPDNNLAWNNTTGDRIHLTSNFGTIILVDNNLPDTTPPAAISDLNATTLSAVEVNLDWTSPGDDGMVGLSTAYEIRYSTETINDSNWESAHVVEQTLAPEIAGTQQSFIVSGLTGGTTYYFAIKSIDEAGNVSALSNIVNTETSAADLIAPAAITDLKVVKSRPISIEICWTATGDDGSDGTATSYDIRYSQSSITEANWDSYPQQPNTPVPQAAGSQQSVIVIGLNPSTEYNLAIRAIDGQNNISPISNIVTATTSELVVNAKTPMDQFIGVNAFIDDPLDKMMVAGYIREYHSWNWDEGDIWDGGGNLNYPGYPNNQNAFNPSWAGGGWNFDNFYKDLTDAGLFVCPAIQGSVKWLNDEKSFPSSNIPVRSGLDRNDPTSYREHADHMFQFAARYGSTHVSDELLKLADNQTRVSGLGYVSYLENWNEPDNWWDGDDAEFTPANLAAMGSADRDGHEGTMGNTYGVKNADPNMKLVMGGLTQRGLDDNFSYIEEIRQWCLENRTDKQFVYDVINVHHYCGQISPEEAKIKETIQQLVDYRDQYMPDCEIWLTEFGWETSIYDTPFSAIEVGSFSREEVQAQRIVREYLLLSSTGIDRAAQYMLRNVENNGRGQHTSSGFTSVKGEWFPKPSWYYVYTMKNTLKGMFYIGEQASMNSNVNIYKYQNEAGDTTVYALWCPTSNEVVVADYQLSLPNAPTSATLVEMVVDETEGVKTDLKIARNTVLVNVSERPVFVITTSNANSAGSVKIQNKAFSLYPSYTSNTIGVNLTFGNTNKSTKVTIMNQVGNVVSENESNLSLFRIDVSHFVPGVYFARIKSGIHSEVHKFIKY
ncbi:MAG: fibronectin type III domain-containing protein [Prolixibacteraceae bacterium]|nr:fibronectin type III domain-containing protein [Prolixibacteraceae bacterium]